MKILNSITYYIPNISGVTVYASRLGERIVKRGHEVSVLTARHLKDQPKEELINGVRVIRSKVHLQLGKGPIMLGLLFDAIKEIRKSDIVHCHVPQYEISLVAVIAKIFRKKIIITHHTDLSVWPGIFNKLILVGTFISQFIAGLLADRIVTYTKDYAEHSYYLRFFKRKLEYVYPPIILEDKNIKSAYRVEKKRKYTIGYSGRIAKQKGLPHLFNCIPYLEKAIGENFEIILAGPYREVIGENTYDEMSELIELHKDKLRFLSSFPPEQMGDFYKALDVFVLPSDDRLESFGIVQVEAMYAGVPVVASDLPGMRQPIKVTGMGEIVEVANPEALAEKLALVIVHRAKYIKTYSEIDKIFSINKNIDFYEKLYKSL